jgi:formylglycine-generating enzyme required for sulfatase activity
VDSLLDNLNLYRYRRTNKSYTEDLGSRVHLTLMLIPEDEFTMGAPEDEPESDDRERPQHLVRVPQFLLGLYPVTQAQWRVVAGYQKIDRELNPDPSRFKGDDRPVEKVSWDDAQEFCQRLSAESGKDYRLPSEAQWEYACRAGTLTPFSFGEIITTEVANYNGNYTYRNGPQGKYCEKTTDVGIFPANDWGLYDMHGNVLEWCEDDWHNSHKGAPRDGSAWRDSDQTNSNKLLRGGSWNDYPRYCRSAYRNFVTRDGTYGVVGFRVCCKPPRILLSP